MSELYKWQIYLPFDTYEYLLMLLEFTPLYPLLKEVALSKSMEQSEVAFLNSRFGVSYRYGGQVE
ncbi:hypothetical protein WJR50_31865 [Catalinimonas sp. 4WD22]|uniref:hypothetical protein n=1 Tax=Catalinimonas locisalis TaxID=3133978 RepID=UPI0031016009